MQAGHRRAAQGDCGRGEEVPGRARGRGGVCAAHDAPQQAVAHELEGQVVQGQLPERVHVPHSQHHLPPRQAAARRRHQSRVRYSHACMVNYKHTD